MSTAVDAPLFCRAVAAGLRFGSEGVVTHGSASEKRQGTEGTCLASLPLSSPYQNEIVVVKVRTVFFDEFSLPGEGVVDLLLSVSGPGMCERDPVGASASHAISNVAISSYVLRSRPSDSADSAGPCRFGCARGYTCVARLLAAFLASPVESCFRSTTSRTPPAPSSLPHFGKRRS